MITLMLVNTWEYFKKKKSLNMQEYVFWLFYGYVGQCFLYNAKKKKAGMILGLVIFFELLFVLRRILW
jgi:hypothetical protein